MPAILAGISDARLCAAGVVVLLYLAACAYFLWPRRATFVSGVAANDSSSAATLIAFASQTGFAADLANRTAQSLQTAGAPVRLASLKDIDERTLRAAKSALFVVSTTGEGDAPDPAAGFVRNILDS